MNRFLLTAAIASIAALSTARAEDAPIRAKGAILERAAGDPACTKTCVVLDRQPTRIGQPISGLITWRNAPKGSILYLSLERTDSLENRVRILNAKRELQRRSPRMPVRFDGPLLTSAIPISGSGGLRFKWSGRSFACALPTGSVVCEGRAEPGPHVIDVFALDSRTLTRQPAPKGAPAPKVLLHARSKGFSLD